MAPTAPPEQKPSARTLRHQRVTGQIHPLLPSKLFRPDAAVSDSFLSTKRDKRLIKHSSFLSRIQSSSTSRISKPGHRRRRRPGNKIASLDSLGDALPDVEDGDDPAKVKHRSLKSRKGALKRKEKVVKGEMQRFGMSMARLAETTGTTAQQGSAVPKGDDHDDGDDEMDDKPGQGNKTPEQPSHTPAATSNRWAALRGYISATMEQNPAFSSK